jgi:hypothetical protein
VGYNLGFCAPHFYVVSGCRQIENGPHGPSAYFLTTLATASVTITLALASRQISRSRDVPAGRKVRWHVAYEKKQQSIWAFDSGFCWAMRVAYNHHYAAAAR